MLCGLWRGRSNSSGVRHINPATKIDNVSNISRMGSSAKKIIAEIEKCEIRCANCHRRKTAKQLGWYRA